MPVKIITKPYGEIEVEENRILEFPDGILAFEELQRYAILPAKKDTGFHWLQSLDEAQLAFLILKPADFIRNYIPDFKLDLLNSLQLSKIEDAEIWSIVTIPPGNPEKMTINLQGPLILNREKCLGGQFISENEKHVVRAPVLELIDRGEI